MRPTKEPGALDLILSGRDALWVAAGDPSNSGAPRDLFANGAADGFAADVLISVAVSWV